MKKILIKFIAISMFCFMFLGSAAAIELKNVAPVPNKLSFAVPASFQKMPQDILNTKYPQASRPQLVYTNEETTINVTFSQTQTTLKNTQIPEVKDSLKPTIEAIAIEWYDDGVVTVNGKNVAYLEFLSQAPDCNIYNHMMIAEVNNKLVIISVNCPEENMDEWKLIAKDIMNSIKIK